MKKIIVIFLFVFLLINFLPKVLFSKSTLTYISAEVLEELSVAIKLILENEKIKDSTKILFVGPGRSPVLFTAFLSNVGYKIINIPFSEAPEIYDKLISALNNKEDKENQKIIKLLYEHLDVYFKNFHPQQVQKIVLIDVVNTGSTLVLFKKLIKKFFLNKGYEIPIVALGIYIGLDRHSRNELNTIDIIIRPSDQFPVLGKKLTEEVYKDYAEYEKFPISKILEKNYKVTPQISRKEYNELKKIIYNELKNKPEWRSKLKYSYSSSKHKPDDSPPERMTMTPFWPNKKCEKIFSELQK